MFTCQKYKRRLLVGVDRQKTLTQLSDHRSLEVWVVGPRISTTEEAGYTHEELVLQGREHHRRGQGERCGPVACPDLVR